MNLLSLGGGWWGGGGRGLSLEWLIHGGFGGSGRKGYLWSAFNAIIFYQKMNFFRHNLVINKKVFWNISLITNSKLSDESTVHEGLVLEAKFRCSMVSLPLGYQLKIIFFLNIFFNVMDAFPMLMIWNYCLEIQVTMQCGNFSFKTY